MCAVPIADSVSIATPHTRPDGLNAIETSARLLIRSSAQRASISSSRPASAPSTPDQLAVVELEHDGGRQRSLPHEQQVGIDHHDTGAGRLDRRGARLDVGRRHVVAVLAREPVQHAARDGPATEPRRSVPPGVVSRKVDAAPHAAPTRSASARIASKSTASGPSSRNVSRRTPGIAR